jgi:hypothetical protein
MKDLKSVYVGVKKNDETRNQHDFYPTPPIATYVLCKYTNVPSVIVEPCAGRGNISVELQRNGKKVYSSDLYTHEPTLCKIETGKDALTLIKPNDAIGLITNPPYHKNIPHKLLEKALLEYTYVALLVRITFLEGIKRHKLFSQYTPSNLLIFSDRLNFSSKQLEPIDLNEQIDGMICYCWIVFDRTAKHDNTKLNWILMKNEYKEWKLNYEKQTSIT